MAYVANIVQQATDIWDIPKKVKAITIFNKGAKYG
jgi:hypothetical protein